MKLVIAEKPSVAQSLAAVIGATARKDGYLEGGGWRVSWCVGHLAGLADADAYNPDYAKWRYDDLPILPEPWQMVVSKDKKKQFDVLKQLMNAPDVTEVVNACDAGREGELIFRAVYELAGCTKPMKRLWISSMEDSAIREGFANLRPGTDYDGLRDAALCRAKADWLVGINATRLFSVLYHRTLNIGRVMSPTLALIVQREAEIDTFKPVPFYTVTLELPGFTVSGERMVDKAAAQQLKTACQGAAATVKKVERKDKSEKPPALYDLTTLQRDANRLLGFTAQQTLDYLQNLYEKKLCTYPRTDSRYLTSDMAASLPELVQLTAGAMPFSNGMEIACNAAQIVNDKTINKTSCELINDIERNYKEICKERGIDLTAATEPKQDSIEQLASDIDQFTFDYDPYEYRNNADSREDALHELTATLRSGDASGVREWLQNIVNEDEPDETTQKAAELMGRLDQLVPMTEPEQLTEPENTESVQPSAEYREALLVLDDTSYLHVQPCDTGWDYTLYDVATMKQMDGGQLDGPDMGRSTAVSHICEDLGMGGKSIKYAPLSMIETLQEAAYQQTAEAAATQLPDAQEQALDEYPMPDPVLTQDDLEKCGCLDSDLLPLSKERAYELMDRDLTVYIIQEGENPEMAFDTADLDAHDGIFAVSREEWEESPEFHEKVLERQDRQLEREQAFLSHEGNCFAIYQVSQDDPQNVRFMNLDWLQSHNLSVERSKDDGPAY